MIEPIKPNSPTFGIRTGSKLRQYTGYHVIQESGIFKGNKLDIYSAYEDGKLINKLYYLADETGKWIKSKLNYYKDGKLDKVVRSKSRDFDI